MGEVHSPPTSALDSTSHFQVLGLFNRTVRKMSTFLHKIEFDFVEEELKLTLGDEHAADSVVVQPLGGLEDELVCLEVLLNGLHNVNFNLSK